MEKVDFFRHELKEYWDAIKVRGLGLIHRFWINQLFLDLIVHVVQSSLQFSSLRRSPIESKFFSEKNVTQHTPDSGTPGTCAHALMRFEIAHHASVCIPDPVDNRSSRPYLMIISQSGFCTFWLIFSTPPLVSGPLPGGYLRLCIEDLINSTIIDL